jgi:transmembrane sensor
MNISREQYHRFLTNQCSEEERLLFASYLEQHPEVLEQWLQSTDWEQFTDDTHLHPAFSGRMRNKLMDYIQERKRRRTTMQKLTVAAVIAGAIAFTTVWIIAGQRAHAPMAVKQKALPADTWQLVNNPADTATTIILGDRSVVKLYPHSNLRYKKTFDAHKRDIFLEGVAHFAVAKNKARPFTVYAQGIATTAVGTAFTVIAKPRDKNVQVKLHEGKVFVRAADTTTAITGKEIYLLPGDELAISNTGKYDLKHNSPVKKETADNLVKKNKPTGGDALSFNNTPLADVLQQLKQKFGADIRYNPEDLKTIFITASFTEQDTLPGILDILCALNNLRLQHADATFTVTR